MWDYEGGRISQVTLLARMARVLLILHLEWRTIPSCSFARRFLLLIAIPTSPKNNLHYACSAVIEKLDEGKPCSLYFSCRYGCHFLPKSCQAKRTRSIWRRLKLGNPRELVLFVNPLSWHITRSKLQVWRDEPVWPLFTKEANMFGIRVGKLPGYEI